MNVRLADPRAYLVAAEPRTSRTQPQAYNLLHALALSMGQRARRSRHQASCQSSCFSGE